MGIAYYIFLFHFKVFDQSALSLEAKEEMYKLYPNARRAHLKTGGNFPYLCRSAEVNLYIQVKAAVEIISVKYGGLVFFALTVLSWSFFNYSCECTICMQHSSTTV